MSENNRQYRMTTGRSSVQIVFIYNADDGFFNAISSSMHRVFSPATYECNLCFYTHDLIGMNRKWKQFLDSLPCSIAFYYRKEFRQAHPDIDVALPAVIAIDGRTTEVLVSAEEIRDSGSLERLIELTRDRIHSVVKPASVLNADGGGPGGGGANGGSP